MGKLMRRIQAPLEKSGSTAQLARRAAMSAFIRCATLFPASVVSVLLVGCVACPTARAETTYGPGTYTVPGQLPHGIYTAGADMRDFAPACSFSTWTSDGKFINGDSVTAGKTLTANISASVVAQFITHGCTPWIK